MSRASRVEGIDRTIALVEGLAPAARDELADTLATLGAAIQAQQQALAPERTGKLRQAITWQAAVERLQLKVGLLGKHNSDAYYGHFVNFGRRSQSVLVQRRRRVNGKLRTLNRRKRTEDIVSAYTLHVKARAAQPFVVLGAQMGQTVDTALSDFWSRVLARSGAA